MDILGKMVDYHVHSDYSQDAEGSVADYCRQALALGLTEICFTPHFEIDPVRKELDDRVRLDGQWVPMLSDWIDRYIADVEQARREFAPLEVKLGVEVGYDPSIEKELADWLRRYPFDYVLGSIHCIDHIAITAHDENDFYYARANAQEATEGYFDLLNRAIESGLFDAIGHIDVFKKYSMEKFGNELVERAKPYWPGVFERILRHPPLTIEINTSGLRHAPVEMYPSEAVLKVARNAGLEHVAIGSDGHRLKHLGFGLEQGLLLPTGSAFGLRAGTAARQLPRQPPMNTDEHGFRFWAICILHSEITIPYLRALCVFFVSSVVLRIPHSAICILRSEIPIPSLRALCAFSVSPVVLRTMHSEVCNLHSETALFSLCALRAFFVSSVVLRILRAAF